MIYDKNQFVFNFMITSLAIVMIAAVYYYGKQVSMNYSELTSIRDELTNIEENQAYLNYIQGSHDNFPFQLTQNGFFVRDVNDYGTIRGASMQPTIFEGNTLIEIKYANQTLKQGQIIRYLDDSKVPVIHRIRAVYDNTLHVQGDNLPDGEIIDKSQVTHIIAGVLFS